MTPVVNGKEFSYSKSGRKAAARASRNVGKKKSNKLRPMGAGRAGRRAV